MTKIVLLRRAASPGVQYSFPKQHPWIYPVIMHPRSSSGAAPQGWQNAKLILIDWSHVGLKFAEQRLGTWEVDVQIFNVMSQSSMYLFHPNITIWILQFPSPFASRQTRFKFFPFICAMPTTTVDPPNPSTPMAWLPPEIAELHTLQLYIAVGSLAVSKLILKFSRFRSNPIIRFSCGTSFYIFLKIILWWQRSDLTSHLLSTLSQGVQHSVPDARDLNEMNRLSGLAYVLSFVIVESVPFSLPVKGFYLCTNSNFSCTNWQLQLHASSRFFARHCCALYRPSPGLPCRRSLYGQKIRRRFLWSVLACLSGQFYRCVYNGKRHANRKHSVLRRGHVPDKSDTQCDWTYCPWHIDFHGNGMGFYEGLVHKDQCGKFLQHYSSRKASSCILQVTLTGWAALFSVIIVLVVRMTRR